MSKSFVHSARRAGSVIVLLASALLASACTTGSILGEKEIVHGHQINDDSLARARHGNAVMLVCRPHGHLGGEVVTVGTTDWVFALAGDPAVAQVTRNVLDRFLD